MITAKSTIFTDRSGNPIIRQFTPLAWAALKEITRGGRKHPKQGWTEVKAGETVENFYPPEMESKEVKSEPKSLNEMTKADVMSMIKEKNLNIDINRPLGSIKSDLKKWMERQ